LANTLSPCQKTYPFSFRAEKAIDSASRIVQRHGDTGDLLEGHDCTIIMIGHRDILWIERWLFQLMQGQNQKLQLSWLSINAISTQYRERKGLFPSYAGCRDRIYGQPRQLELSFALASVEKNSFQSKEGCDD
jgi:hypothetical protein